MIKGWLMMMNDDLWWLMMTKGWLKDDKGWLMMTIDD